jgi:phage gp46-like protein
MGDIATIWDPGTSRGDWSLPAPAFAFVADANGNPVIGPDGFAVAVKAAGAQPGAGLLADLDLQTAVLISIFTDAVADPDDQILDGSGDPRGWWGDSSIGSKLWLRLRAKQTPQTLLLVKADITAALAWLIEDGVAAAVDIVTEWTRPGFLGCQVTVRRQDGSSVATAFDWAWKDL